MTTQLSRNQLSRNALLYLLAAFSACVLLLAIFLPWWLLPLASFCLLWRFLIFRGRLSFPSGWIKFVLVLLSGAALFMQFGFSVSLDVFVMLLLLGFSLKLLELYHQNSAQLLLYLSFFVLMTVFLFEQTPFYALLVFMATVLVLAAIVAVQSADSELQLQWWQPLRKAGVIFMLALPVMFFMFVVMPRLPPLWKMPLQAQHAKTGMSDSMSPGDIASLAQSADLAFRATFPEGVPNRHELYWYGLILDHFDGVSWTEFCRDCAEKWQNTDALPAQNIAGKSYQVILEPHGNQWAYVLLPSAVHDADMQINHDGIVRYSKDVGERRIYEALYMAPIIPARPILQHEKKYLALPEKGNPQSRALARQWLADNKKSNDDARLIVQTALDFYHQSFSYTLQPPLLGEQRIDDFLFGTRSGFCEHFASSFVFLMRAAGIPARVVVGYMGGEIHEQDKYVVVRQYDAHAWAEVWLPDAGWVRVDPTAAVAPERIDLGFFDAFSNDENFSGDVGLAAFHQVALLNKLRLQLDRIDYLWARWVLGYEGSQQQQLLEKMGLLSPLRIAMWGGGGVLLMFISLCLYLYWREWWSAHELPATRRYRQLCHAYAQCGIERLPDETPLQYAEKIADTDYMGADVFLLLSQQYYAWLYMDDYLQAAEPAPDFFAISRRLYWQLLFNWFVSKKWL